MYGIRPVQNQVLDRLYLILKLTSLVMETGYKSLPYWDVDAAKIDGVQVKGASKSFNPSGMHLALRCRHRGQT